MGASAGDLPAAVAAAAAVAVAEVGIGRDSFDSKTSNPRSFWLMRDSGWKRLAFRTCLSNHVLTSFCAASGSS